MNHRPADRKISGLRNLPAFLLLGVLIALAGCPLPFDTGVVDLLQDLAPPELVVTLPENESLFQDSISIVGTAIDLDSAGASRDLSDPAAIPEVRWEIPVMEVGGTVTTAADGSFSLEIDTSTFDRDVTLFLTAVDENNNETVNQLRLLYDSRGPAVTITSPENQSIFGKTVTVTGTVLDVANPDSTSTVQTLSYEVGNTALAGSITFDESTGAFSFSFDTTGIATDIVIRVTATDNQGDATTAILSLAQDDLGPHLTITNPDNYSVFTQSITVSGSVVNGLEDPAVDEVHALSYSAVGGSQSGDLTFDSAGEFSFDVDATGVSSDVVITVSATDIHGFTSSASLILLNDRQGPFVEITTPESGYYGPLIQLSGNVRNSAGDSSLSEVDASSVSWRVPGTVLSGPLTLDSAGNYAADIDASSLETNIVLEVVASDLNGNESVQQVSLLKPAGGGDINVTTTVDNGAIVFGWNDVAGSTNYRIEESVFGGIRDGVTLDANDEYRWDGLQNGTFHEFQVIATVPGYDDAVSSPIVVAPMSTASFRPWVVPSEYGQIDVQWQPSLSAEARYLVERRTNGGGWTSAVVTGSAGYRDTNVEKDSVYEYRVTLRGNGPSTSNVSTASAAVRPQHFPAQPVLGARTVTGETYRDIERSGSYLFATTTSRELIVYDVSNPAVVVEVASLPSIGDYFRIDGSVLYAVDPRNLVVVDITDPTSPSLENTVQYSSTSNSSYRVRPDGDELYIIANSEVEVYDISTPALKLLPGALGTITVGEQVNDIALVGTYLYVSRHDSCDVAFGDLTGGYGSVSFSAVTGIGSYTPNPSSSSNKFRQITQSADHLFVRQQRNGFVVIDVTTPSSPSAVNDGNATTYGTGDLWYDSVRDEVTVADAYFDGVKIFDVSNPLSIPSPTQVLAGGAVVDVATYGGYTFAAETDYGNGAFALSVVDRSEPDTPAILDTLALSSFGAETSTRMVSVAVSGDTVYALGEEGHLWIVDISDPSALTTTGSIKAAGNGTDVGVAEGIAYVGGEYFEVATVDVSNPALPALLDSDGQGFLNRVSSLAVAGEYLYANMFANDYFGVFDASRPDQVEAVLQLGGGGQGGVIVDGTYAYTADLVAKTVQGYDITNPMNPVPLPQYTIPGGGTEVYDMVVADGRAYVYTSGDVVILDIASNRESISQLGTVAISSQGAAGFGLAVDGPYMIVGSNSTVEVWDIANAGAPAQLTSIAVNAQAMAIHGRYGILGHRDSTSVTVVDLDAIN